MQKYAKICNLNDPMAFICIYIHKKCKNMKDM